MKISKTKDLCIKALLTAIIMLATMVFQIPVPATNGYIHLGDGLILLISVIFGWKYGFISAAIGSSFADIFTGYAHWSIFTFIIKGLMAFVTGKLSENNNNDKFLTLKNVTAPIWGVLIMIVGYLLAGTLLNGSFMVSLTSVPSNAVQGFGGYIIYLALGKALYSQRKKFHAI